MNEAKLKSRLVNHAVNLTLGALVALFSIAAVMILGLN
ncbi:hypothetical protein DM15PD_01250 [Aristophania vespae]|nr:hypothetical protein DM15PD_01250 [Aristophania vespae]